MRDKTIVMDHSENQNKKGYTVGDICMVSQTNTFLQFSTARISQILIFTVRYLTTNESDNISIWPQVKLLNQIGRGSKKRRYRRHSIPISGNMIAP